MFMWVCLCESTFVNAGTQGDQKRATEPLELEVNLVFCKSTARS